MAKRFLYSITFDGDTVWLTSDGTEDGRRCKTEPTAIDHLFDDISGNTTVAAGGSPFTESPLNNGGGKAFEINVVNCPTARYNELIAIRDAAGKTGELTITIEGEPGSKTVTAVWHWNPIPIGFDPEFSTAAAYLRNVRLRFITTPA